MVRKIKAHDFDDFILYINIVCLTSVLQQYEDCVKFQMNNYHSSCLGFTVLIQLKNRVITIIEILGKSLLCSKRPPKLKNSGCWLCCWKVRGLL